MEYEEYVEYIEKKLHEKGINIQTQDYIIKYVSMNEKLFGNIIDHKKMIDRIINNLDYSIKSMDKKASPTSELVRIATQAGTYKPYPKKINVNPFLKFASFISPRGKQVLESVIMHEIDHCATTEYLQIGEQEKEQYLQEYISNKKDRNSFLVKKATKFINDTYDKYDGKLPISGIFDYRQLATKGLNLRYLNEGITEYKQDMYDKFNGYKTRMEPYKTQKLVAQFIGKVIGEENLISMHFNNNYEGIRPPFNAKTGKDLNDVVKKLNRNTRIERFLGRVTSGNMKKFLNDFYQKDTHQKRENAQFVPEVEVNYSDIKEKEELGEPDIKLEKQENFQDR